MSRATQATVAILRKDFLQLWPLVVITAALLLMRNLAANYISGTSGMATLLMLASSVACCTLLIAAVQQDALVSERHDWLTRPIPRISLFVAKTIFILATIMVPADLSSMLAALIDGRSASESILMGTQFSVVWFAPLLALAGIAAMTRSLLQAAGMLLGIAVVAIGLEPLIARLGVGVGEEVFAGGSAWIPLWIYLSILIVASVIVLWSQYARRHLSASRVTVAAAVSLALCVPALLSWRVVFAVQKTFSSATDDHAFEATLAPGCLPAISVEPFDSGSERSAPVDPRLVSRLDPSVWPSEQREAAGHNAVGFSATLDSKVAAGWRANIGYVTASYLSPDDAVLGKAWSSRLTPARTNHSDGAASDSHFWLISRANYDSLRAQGARLRLQYSFSLLEPVATTTITADGTPHFAEGLGYCSAKVNNSKRAVEVTCLKRGSQPAYIVANFAEEPAYEAKSSGFPDYTPAILELLTVRNRQIQLPLPQTPRLASITVTAFEPRAHKDAQFILPGMLGDASCKL